MRERVNGGRLIVAGHDDGPAAMRLQVLGDGGDPLLGERGRRAGLSAGSANGRRKLLAANPSMSDARSGRRCSALIPVSVGELSTA